MNLETVLKALPFLSLAIPEIRNLVDEIKTVFDQDDVSELEKAIIASDAEADEQHRKAQEL